MTARESLEDAERPCIVCFGWNSILLIAQWAARVVVVVLRARAVHAIYSGKCMHGTVGHVESSISLAPFGVSV